MSKIAEGNKQMMNDVDQFIGMINERAFFAKDKDVFVARAPGRLDVMGGIADYSGSLVLQMPIAEATLAAVQKRDDCIILIVSIAAGEERRFETSLSRLASGDLADIQKLFRGSDHWAAYVGGAFAVLAKEKGIEFERGSCIFIYSDVPIGKGVSSSAAIEVAVMNAVCAAFDIVLDPRSVALLCQKVENEIVGAPCGVMDQIASNCGIENALISLHCQPAEIKGTVAIPDEIEFWGIDSGVRHAVAGADYSSVRVGAFMGYRIISELAGLKIEQCGNGIVEIQDENWRGYLCSIIPDEYEKYRSNIPDEIKGAEFLARYRGFTDRVTKIDPLKSYNVKAATEHAVYENARVNEFEELLRSQSEESFIRMGEMMFASHASYAACGLTEPGTDRLVELVRTHLDDGLFGARITGGGSGGTVAVLSIKNNGETVEKIASQYAREFDRTPYIFHGSSPGSAEFGMLRLKPL